MADKKEAKKAEPKLSAASQKVVDELVSVAGLDPADTDEVMKATAPLVKRLLKLESELKAAKAGAK